jgi:hypothetical protein
MPRGLFVSFGHEVSRLVIGMSDFVVVEHSHAFMMKMDATIELTKRSLRLGRF